MGYWSIKLSIQSHQIALMKNDSHLAGKNEFFRSAAVFDVHLYPNYHEKHQYYTLRQAK